MKTQVFTYVWEHAWEMKQQWETQGVSTDMEGWHESSCVLSASPLHLATFDPYKELVWVADDAGRVMSYFGPHLRPYTSIKAHNSPVIDLQVTDKYVYSLSDEGVRIHKRTGLLKGHDPNALGSHMIVSENELLLASGNRVNRRTIDPPRETGTFAIDLPEGVTITFMKRCTPHVCLGLSNGSVCVVDTMMFETLFTVSCHSGPLTDVDVRKSIIMTCGMSTRRYGLVTDQVVSVYDARVRKALPMLSLSTGATLVRMHPKSPTNCVVVGPANQIQFMDARNPSNIVIHQMQAQSTVVCMDISPQGDSLVLVEQHGVIHYWTKDVVTDFKMPKNLDLPSVEQPQLQMKDSTPLSAIGLPFYQEELLSSWSDPVAFEVGMPAPRDLENCRSNVATKYVSVLKSARRSSVSVPRFISERERLGLKSNNDHFFSTSDNVEQGKVPKVYRQLQIHYSKFGVNDFDFSFYNKTKHAGLETQVAGNMYCNALLQVLRWCAPIHNIALQKFARFNYTPSPVMGELAIMFDMLKKSDGRQCRASNFLAMLAANPQAKSLGLLDLHRPLSTQIAGLYYFLTSAFVQEEENYTKSVELPDSIGMTVTSRMYGSCGHRADEETQQLGLSAHSADLKGLNTSLSRTTDSWVTCAKCQKQHSMAIVRQVTALRDVIVVTLAPSSAAAASAGAPAAAPAGAPAVGRAPATRFSLSMRADKRSFKLVDSDRPDYELQGFVAEIADARQRHAVAIIKVAGQWHLFNDFLVTPLPEEQALDFAQRWKQPLLLLYKKTSADVEFDYTSWKEHLDCQLLYDRRIISGNLDAVSRAVPLEPDAPHKGTLVALDAEFVLLSQEVAEIHSDGTKALLQPSQMSLARVSVLRGSPPHIEQPFIDDFVETRHSVVDYLTLYSGIEQGDLDPHTSPHALVSLQTATRRLWLLLNRGCIFVGHALVNDFRTINLQIPADQVIDTIELFHDISVSGHRRLSLKFLIWALLGENIQAGNHDSIEDARAALRLYFKYKQLKQDGEFDAAMQDVYAKGQINGFRVPEPGTAPHELPEPLDAPLDPPLDDAPDTPDTMHAAGLPIEPKEMEAAVDAATAAAAAAAASN